MTKKFELVKEDSISINGTILHRVRALKDFADVSAGDLGGYIEKEENLSQEGYAWVYDKACVYDDARIFGDAEVFRNARVFGDAQVCDNAKVYDDALISEGAYIGDHADVSGNALIYGNASIYNDVKVYGHARIHGEFTRIEGHATVYDYAEIYDDAQVSGHASIFGKAKVYNNAEIRDDAKVFGNANVCHRAVVEDEAKIDENVRICEQACIGGDIHIRGDLEIGGYTVIEDNEDLRGFIEQNEKVKEYLRVPLDKAEWADMPWVALGSPVPYDVVFIEPDSIDIETSPKGNTGDFYISGYIHYGVKPDGTVADCTALPEPIYMSGKTVLQNSVQSIFAKDQDDLGQKITELYGYTLESETPDLIMNQDEGLTM